MRAAVIYGKRDIRLEQVPVPTLEAEDVLVEMKVAGISGIEPIIYEGEYVAKDGIIAGFQAAGFVRQIGDKVTAVKVGQRVSFDPNIYCGGCYYCKRGDTLFCENLQGYGVHRSGTFADYFSVPEASIYVLPDDVSFEDAALIEHTSCVLHAVEISRIELGDTVVVLGTGVVGGIFIQLAKAKGAASIIAIDISKIKLDKALEMGADYAIDASKEDVTETILKLTNGRGVDIVYDTAAVPSSLEQAVTYAAKGANIIIFAIHPKEGIIKLNPFDLLEKEICIQAAYCNPRTYGKALNMIANKKINLKPLISDEVNLDDLVKGIEKKRDEEVFYILVKN